MKPDGRQKHGLSVCDFNISDILTLCYTSIHYSLSWLVLIIILRVEWVYLCVWDCSGYFGTAVKSGRSWGVCWHCRTTTMILTVRERNGVCVWEKRRVCGYYQRSDTLRNLLLQQHSSTALLHMDKGCWARQGARFPCQTPTVTKANIFHHNRPAFSHWPCTSFTHTHTCLTKWAGVVGEVWCQRKTRAPEQ